MHTKLQAGEAHQEKLQDRQSAHTDRHRHPPSTTPIARPPPTTIVCVAATALQPRRPPIHPTHPPPTMAAPVVEKQPGEVTPVAPAVDVPPIDVTRPPRPQTGNAVFDSLANAYHAFQTRREALGLSNPGSIEQIAKEVQRDVFLTNQTFSGLRAELNKSLSLNPIFQVSHAFSTGSQMMSPYTFLALYGTDSVSLCRPLPIPALSPAPKTDDVGDRPSFKAKSTRTSPSPPASTPACTRASSSSPPCRSNLPPA